VALPGVSSGIHPLRPHFSGGCDPEAMQTLDVSAAFVLCCCSTGVSPRIPGRPVRTMLGLYLSGLLAGAVLGLMMPKKKQMVDVGAESTRVPEDDDELQSCSQSRPSRSADDDEDMKSMHTQSNRESSTRSNRQKGIGRVEKMRLKAQRHVEANGGVWEDREGLRPVNRKAMEELKAGMDMESSTLSKTEWIKEVLKVREEAFSMPAGLHSSPAPEYLWNQDGRCTLCSKWVDDSHKMSSTHGEKACQAGALDKVLGEVKGRVLYQGCMAPKGVMMKREDLIRFWGPELPNLPSLGLSIIRNHPFVEVRVSTKRTVKLPTSEITGAALGIVPYSGQGVYQKQDSVLIYWELIPNSDSTIDDLAMFQAQEATESQTWWPVLVLQLTPAALLLVGVDHWIVICIYQLLCGTVIWGWRIVPASWLM